MMVPSKSRKSKPYLALAISVVFATATASPIHAQPQTPPSSQSPASATPNPSGTRQPKRAFGGQLAVFLGHEGGIQDAVFSPDGSQILTASQDKTARLWDRQGNLLAVFRGHENWVQSAEFSPDGRQILTASGDRTARLWDLKGNLLAMFGGSKHKVSSAKFSPDGRQILTTSAIAITDENNNFTPNKDNTAQLWDSRGNLLTVFRGHEEGVRSAVFSPDGNQILTASNDKTARLWDRQGNLLLVLRGHEETILSAIFSPDGQQILTASLDGTARLWDRRGNLLTVFQHGTYVDDAVLSPDGRQILTSGFRDARLWDRKGNLLAVFNKDIDIIISGLNSVPQFSPNGQYIVTSHRVEGAGLWDTKGNLLATLPPISGFSPDGRQILTASYNAVRLRDVSDAIASQAEKAATMQAFQKDVARKTAQLKVFQDDDSVFEGALFSPDSQKILTTSDDDIARLWDRQGNFLTRIEIGESFKCATFSPNGQQILTARDNIAQLWDQQGRLLATLRGHNNNDTITCAEFSPNGQYILTNGSRDTARLWDHQGNLLINLGVGVRNATFSPDGQRILGLNISKTVRVQDLQGNPLTPIRGDKTVRVWDLQGNPLTTIRGGKAAIDNATFSPDGQQILTTAGSLRTVNTDSIVRLWDFSGNLLTVFQGHEDLVFSAKFSPDGRQILTSSVDKTDRLWDRQGNLVAILRHGYQYRVIHPIGSFSPDGQKILTRGDQTIWLWDRQGTLLAVLRGHESGINSAEFSPDGRQIVTTSMDRTTRLWDVSTAIALQAEETAAQRTAQANVSDKNAPQAEAALQAAIQLTQQGTVESRQQALQKLDEALKLYRADNNLAKAAHALRLMGNSRADLGQFQAALVAYTEALTLAQQAGAKAEEAAILNSLGQLYTDLADPKTALDYHTQALPLLYQLNDKGSAAATFTNIGDIHANTNQWKQAQDAYTQALIISRPAGDLAAEATALAGIGSTYIASADWGTALNAYQQALIITRHLNDKIHESAILNQMGKIHAALGDKATALKHYNQALQISREVGNRLGEATTLSSLAVFYDDRGNSAKAIESYKQSIAIAESIQGEIQIEELKSSFASERIDPYSRLINLLAQQGDFTAAFNYAERAKARAFLDQLANGPIDYGAGADAQLLQQEQDLRQQIAAIESQLNVLRTPPNDRRDERAITEKSAQRDTLRKVRENLLIQIKLRNPAIASLVTVDVAPLADIQRLLEPDTTLVEYFVTGDRTVVFIITRNSFNTITLNISRADLVDKNENIKTGFADPDRNINSVLPELQQIHKALIEPLQKHLNTSRLIVVPHDILHLFPFAALTDGNRYLGDRYTLSFLPSANVLRFLPTSKPATTTTLLALGDPISPEKGGLSNARSEVEAIAALFSTTPFVGKDATETRLRSQAPTANILHLAVHGIVDLINPRSSALYLTPDDHNTADDSNKDGRLEVGEIYGLNLKQSTNLVVLSACQTGIGQQSRGDEIAGLNRAFLYAGTPTVLSSLWNVDDEPTALLMKQFYTHLQTGSDPATALQQAQQAFRQQNPDYTHPYFWSAFSITGRADFRKR